VHDSALQLRLKKLESNLKRIIHSSQQTKEEAFSSDVQTGKITHIAAEIPYAGALYSGPINAAGLPEGVGAIDYGKVGDARGRLTAERRSYYLGTVVAGKRHIADLVLPKSSSLGDLDSTQLQTALGLRTDELLTDTDDDLERSIA
jgi:hypothetical protein